MAGVIPRYVGAMPDGPPAPSAPTPSSTGPGAPASPARPGSRGSHGGRTQARFARWVRFALGVLAVLVGLFLALRPFSSLAVLLIAAVVGLVVAGGTQLVAAGRDGRHLRWVSGALYLAAAVVVLVWPGPTIRVLALVVGVALVVDGALDLWAGVRARGTARWNAWLGGAASVLLGLVALAWPDVTLLVVGLVFGLKVVMLGARAIVAVTTGRPARTGARERARPGRWRLGGNAAVLLLAVVVAVVSVGLQRGAHRPDAFYTPPEAVPAEPGRLIRSEPFAADWVPDGVAAWRILYTTTRDDRTPAVASGLVLVPRSSVGAGAPPADVVTWAHGTTGVSPGCAPSVLESGLAAGAMFVADQVAAHGWAMVATDYVGLGTRGPHAYLVGDATARSVLDSIRAAHQLGGVALADRTVVWGHSQGGGAALWTGVLASSYAPELTLDGVAALAPAANLPELVHSLDGITGGELFAAYVAEGYTSTYPDVRFDDYVRPAARTLVREMAQRCLEDPGVLVSVLSTLVLDKPIWDGDPDRGALHDRLAQNVPSGPIDAPVLVGQGADDSLVLPAAQDAYVRARCDAGYAVDYRTYAGLNHVPLVEAGSPAMRDLFAWTGARFAGQPAADTC